MVRRRQGIGAATIILVALLIVGALVIGAVVSQLPYQQTEKGTSTASPITTSTEGTPSSSLSSATLSSSSNTPSTSTCISPGQPLGAFLQVVSESGSPIVGAYVVVDESEMNVNCTGSSTTGSTSISALYTFTTNGTDWYSLQTLNAAVDQISITYSGHTYNLTMPLGLSVFTCGTIYIPSGVSNFVTSPQRSCATTSGSTTQSATCVITGQPGPMFVRFVSDSNQTSIVGAQVAATNEPAYCGSLPANTQMTTRFTTSSGTEWYSLDTGNNAGYSFVVTYEGQTYIFTASLRPVSVTCATLYIPSGNTNVTITAFKSTC